MLDDSKERACSLELVKDRVCYASKRVLDVGWFPDVEGTWAPVVHSNCVHNEIRALLTRSLKKIHVRSDPRNWVLGGGLKKAAQAYRADLSCGRMGLYETAMSYSGRLRKRYLEAYRSLMEDGPVKKRDAFIKGFLKAEKRSEDNVTKPRMIFPRDPRYNLALASFLKPLEHWLWLRCTGRTFGGMSRLRVSAKGLNPVERASLIRRKMEFVGDCTVFEVDGSAFEAHVDEEQLSWEHSVYLHAYGGDPELRRLLRMQRTNTGVTANGVAFSRRAGRASGDYNTGMGNTLIMCRVIAGCMRGLQSRWDMLVDGDNAILFVRTSHLQQAISAVVDNCVKFGHEVTLEKPTTILEQVTFGQSQPVFFNGRYAMVRDYRKVFSNFASSHCNMKNSGWREYVRAVGVCEEHLANGLPVMGAAFRAVVMHLGGFKPIRFHLVQDYRLFGFDPANVPQRPEICPTPEARLSFEKAFGLSSDYQIALERMDWSSFVCR